MFNFIGTDTNTELIIVYSLIGIIIVLIIIVLLLDHYGKKKEIDRLDSKRVLKNLKKIQKQDLEDTYEDNFQDTIKIDPNNVMMRLSEEVKKEEVQEEIEENNDELQLQTSLNLNIEEEPVKVQEEIIKENIYQEKLNLDLEEALEKTQAQIDVEEITMALEKAIQEEDRIDPYLQFEEEQEENAIISYEELEKNFDRLYDENEKRQYLNDDNLPININELYEKNEEYHNKKEKLEDITKVEIKEEPKVIEKPIIKETSKEEKTNNGFKNSPYISPVYGIQKEPHHPIDNKDIDEELAKTTEFLKTLKELQKHLGN